MDPDELEYCSRWLDFYQFGNSENGVDGVGEIIGYLKEFRQQQESGKTDFKLPEKPKLLAD